MLHCFNSCLNFSSKQFLLLLSLSFLVTIWFFNDFKTRMASLIIRNQVYFYIAHRPIFFNYKRNKYACMDLLWFQDFKFLPIGYEI
jgi:hypothetical protein